MPAHGEEAGEGWFEGISKTFAGDKSDLAHSEVGMDSSFICKWRGQNKVKEIKFLP